MTSIFDRLHNTSTTASRNASRSRSHTPPTSRNDALHAKSDPAKSAPAKTNLTSAIYHNIYLYIVV